MLNEILFLIYFFQFRNCLIFETKVTKYGIKKYFKNNFSFNNSFKHKHREFFLENIKLKNLHRESMKHYHNHFKILKKKIDLNYNLKKKVIFFGSFFQKKEYIISNVILRKKCSLFWKKFLIEKGRLGFFNFSGFIPDWIKDHFLFYDYHFYFNKDLIIFNYFCSRLNTGLAEKIFNIKTNKLKNIGLYITKKGKLRGTYSTFSKVINNLKIRRNRIFNLKIIPKFWKKKIRHETIIWQQYQKGILKCLIFSRHINCDKFILSGNILFLKNNYIFEINKGLVDWLLQLIRENIFLTEEKLPNFRFFNLKMCTKQQILSLFNKFKDNRNKRLCLQSTQKSLGISFLNDDLSWNNKISASELFIDFFLKPCRSGNYNNYNSIWRYSVNIVHLYIISINFCSSKYKLGSNRFDYIFGSKPDFQFFNIREWSNVVLDNRNFLKKNLIAERNFKKISDICQNDKIFHFLRKKLRW